ncbi:MAG: heme exporter protein CcmB [Rhodospirillaceae bacterium]
MSSFSALLMRDLRLALRQSSDSFTVIAFFAIATILFPFGVGPEAAVLARIAAGVVWVAALLAALLSLDRVFAADFDDGSLDQIILSGQSTILAVIAKVAAHWLTTGVPLIIMSPVLAVTLQLPGQGYGTLVLALLLGTPTVSLIGALGAALVLGARRGGVLLSLLVLPLYIPVLIFGTAAVEAAVTGMESGPMLSILGGLALIAGTLCPFATAAALRQAAE